MYSAIFTILPCAKLSSILVHLRRGADEWGAKFVESMVEAGVDVTRLQAYDTPTGVVILFSVQAA
jgi:hypothetical protein